MTEQTEVTKIDVEFISNMLSEVLNEFVGSRDNIAMLKNVGTFPADVLDEVLGVYDDTHDITTKEMVAKRNYQVEIKEALLETCKYVTEITGFKCDTYVVPTKNFPNLKTSLTCYCPKLKLNFYFETLFRVPDNRDFVYYDLAPNGMYARMHNEYKSIHEAIRLEKNIIDYEMPYEYVTKSSEEKREYILDVIRQLASRKCYVGGAIDPRFPQREPEDESEDESDNEQRMMMNLIEMMMYHPDNPHDFDYYDDSIF
jgi:hypothetical protein